MAAENNLWTCTRTRFEKAGVFAQRLENAVSEGVPDVIVNEGPLCAWLENKATKTWPVRPTSKVFGKDGLRPMQVNWLVNAAQRGLHAYVWAGVGVGHQRQTFLVPCQYAEQFNDMARAQLEQYACEIDDLVAALRAGWRGGKG